MALESRKGIWRVREELLALSKKRVWGEREKSRKGEGNLKRRGCSGARVGFGESCSEGADGVIDELAEEIIESFARGETVSEGWVASESGFPFEGAGKIIVGALDGDGGITHGRYLMALEIRLTGIVGNCWELFHVEHGLSIHFLKTITICWDLSEKRKISYFIRNRN
jgi:hypothetical protein